LSSKTAIVADIAPLEKMQSETVGCG